MLALSELDLTYEFTLASATMGPEVSVSKGKAPFGIVGTSDYLEKNPNGTIPTISDGGFVLWESNAIVQYLGMKYNPKLANRIVNNKDLSELHPHQEPKTVQGLLELLYELKVFEKISPYKYNEGYNIWVKFIKTIDKLESDKLYNYNHYFENAHQYLRDSCNIFMV